MSDDLLDEAITKLSKKERKQIALSQATDAQFQQWAAIEIAKAEALKRKQAAAKAKAPEPSEPDELGAMNDAAFADHAASLGAGVRGSAFTPSYSDAIAAYRKGQGSK